MRLHHAIEMLAGAEFGNRQAVWADLGCGGGTFTMALASRLALGSTIHAIDRDPAALRRVPADHRGVTIVRHVADVTIAPDGVDGLDGVLMANSLHYVSEQSAFIELWSTRLAPAGRFLVIEYDTDIANRWVPFPVSRLRLPALFADSGIQDLGRRPSIYHRAALYAAMIEPRARRE